MALTFQPFDWYRTPAYYDIIFDVDTKKEARFIETLYRRHVPRGQRRLLEPACGTGRLMAELARRGFKVTGFDISQGMLDFARTRFEGARLPGVLSQQRMEDFRFRGRFDLAYCLVSTFKYLLTEDAAAAHLRCVAEHLVTGGVYVLGFHLTDYQRTTRERERWVASRAGTEVVCNIQSWPVDRRRRLERVRSRLNVHTGRRKDDVERFETAWDFRTYDNRQFRALLAKVPTLEIVATHDFFYQPDEGQSFDDATDGVVVVLRRR